MQFFMETEINSSMPPPLSSLVADKIEQLKMFLQECIPMGCMPPASVTVSGRGEGVSPGGSVCPGGCTSPCPLHPWIHLPTPSTPREQNTDRCKNITFPQLRLRAVKKRLWIQILCKVLELRENSKNCIAGIFRLEGNVFFLCLPRDFLAKVNGLVYESIEVFLVWETHPYTNCLHCVSV